MYANDTLHKVEASIDNLSAIKAILRWLS